MEPLEPRWEEGTAPQLCFLPSEDLRVPEATEGHSFNRDSNVGQRLAIASYFDHWGKQWLFSACQVPGRARHCDTLSHLILQQPFEVHGIIPRLMFNRLKFREAK